MLARLDKWWKRRASPRANAPTKRRSATLVPARRDALSFSTRRKLVDLTPAKLLAIFNSADEYLAEQILLAAEMEESDADLAGTLRVRRAAVRRLKKNIQPGDPDDERSTAAAEALDELVGQGWWGQLEDWLLRAIWHQHAAVEMLYDRDWNPTGFRAIEPERYYVDRDFQVGLYRDLGSPSSTDLVAFEPGAFVHHTHLAIPGQPGRYAAVRTLAKLWYLAHLNLTGWGKLIDRWGQPFTHFEYDPNTITMAELRTIVDTFLELADEMVVATPQGVNVNLQEPVEHAPNREFAELYARCVSRFLLGQETAQHATAGQDTGATVQQQVRDDLRDDDAEALDDTLATQLIAPWCAWHFGDAVAPPKLRHVAEAALDQERRGRVFVLAQQLGLPLAKAQVYAELGIDTPAQDDELLVAPAGQTVAAAAAVDNVEFEKAMLSFIAQGQMTREMLVNLLDVQEMIRRVGLPLYNQGKGGDAEPWLPLLAPPGMAEVTGEVKRDAEGDIVGGQVTETAPPVGGGGVPFARLARTHPHVCRRGPGGGWLVKPRALLTVLAGDGTGTEAGPTVGGIPGAVREAFEDRVKAVKTFVESAGGFEALRAGLAELYARLTGGDAGPTLAEQIHAATWGAQCAARLAEAERVQKAKGKRQKGTAAARRTHPGQPAAAKGATPPATTALAAGDDEPLRRARFAEAIDQVAQRTDLLPKEEFLRLQGLDRARAWTVARVADLEILKDLHGAVGQAVEGGQSWREFKDSVDTIMEKRGWAGLKPWHARLVYEQNVNMAWSAGRVMQARDAGVTHWRKLPSDSVAPRVEHQKYDNQVFTFEQMTPPPWDFGCKCNWEVVFDEELGDRPDVGTPKTGPPAAEEFEWDASHYYRPRELRKGDYPRELWPVIETLASNANALLRVRE